MRKPSVKLTNNKTMKAMKTIIDEYGVTYTEDRKTLVKGNSALEEYTVPEGTEVIGNDAWGKMDKLKNINLPEGLVEIESLAFSGCMGLTTIQLPSTLKEIGSDAFELTMLRFVQIPEGVTILRNDTFCDCLALGAVVLPSTLEAIEDYAFCCCHTVQVCLMAKERKLNYIDDTAFDGSKGVFLVPYNLQREYAEAFPTHKTRFFGVNIVEGAGKADVYSPKSNIVWEMPVEVQ